MKSIILESLRSASLWTIGLLFFLVFFSLIAIGMILFSPKTIYPAVRILARIQLLIMGNHESLFDVFAFGTCILKPFPPF